MHRTGSHGASAQVLPGHRRRQLQENAGPIVAGVLRVGDAGCSSIARGELAHAKDIGPVDGGCSAHRMRRPHLVSDTTAVPSPVVGANSFDGGVVRCSRDPGVVPPAVDRIEINLD